VRRRPNFPVAVLVVFLVVALAFAASLVRPFVPAPPPNLIATYAGDYLKQASDQQIEWHVADESAFSEARRLDRPVLLFIGVAWSQTARELDQDVLSTSDVQNYLSHNFICVRIDGNEAPAWVSAYLPISRAAIGIRPRFQIWALQPDGKLMGNINRRLPSSRLDQSNFLNDLIRVHDFYTQLRQAGLSADMDAQQRADVAQIESTSPSANMDFGSMYQTVQQSTDTIDGGFALNGYQDLRPYAWQYLSACGDTRLFHNSLMPVLRSPAFDVLDGGFFQSARTLDRSLLEFDKSSMANSEMLCTLAQAHDLFSDAGDRALCDYTMNATFRSLSNEFIGSTGFLCAARIGDEQDNGRSLRSSITPQQLRNALSPDDREWARKYLGLRVENNAQMIAYLASSDSISRVDSIRTKLLAKAAAPTFTHGSFMDINATVAARMMQAGRLTGHRDFINYGSNLFSRLDNARVADTVPHDLEVPGRSGATLLDYLAYSDAALQDYLSSGRAPSLMNGWAVLQRGLSIYGGTVPGEYRIGLPPSSDLLPTAVATAQVVDDLGESGSAKVVRLCTQYGRLLLNSGDKGDTALALLRTAYATENLLAQPMASVGLSGVAFGCASADLVGDEYAIAVGPDAQQLADQLYALRPTRFVAAAFGPVRQDLANKAAGIYILRKGVPSGPFSVAQAASQLPIGLVGGS